MMRGIRFGLLFSAPFWAALAWFVTTDTAARMWSGFLATWLIWAVVAMIAALCIWLDHTCRDYKRGQRITDARAEENRKTLAYAREQQQRDRAKAPQRRGQDTPHTTTDRRLRITPVTSIDEARREAKAEGRREMKREIADSLRGLQREHEAAVGRRVIAEAKARFGRPTNGGAA